MQVDPKRIGCTESYHVVGLEMFLKGTEEKKSLPALASVANPHIGMPMRLLIRVPANSGASAQMCV